MITSSEAPLNISAYGSCSQALLHYFILYVSILTMWNKLLIYLLILGCLDWSESHSLMEWVPARGQGLGLVLWTPGRKEGCQSREREGGGEGRSSWSRSLLNLLRSAICGLFFLQWAYVQTKDHPYISVLVKKHKTERKKKHETRRTRRNSVYSYNSSSSKTIIFTDKQFFINNACSNFNLFYFYF